MKGKTINETNTRPILNKLKKDYTKHANGNLAAHLSALVDAEFYADEMEYVFQLLEAELRGTDSIKMKALLERFKASSPERWKELVARAALIASEQVQSAVSHQLVALIELVNEP